MARPESAAAASQEGKTSKQSALQRMSIYDAASSVVVSREHLAVLKPVLQGDVEHLLQLFVAQPEHTFEAFDAVWDHLKFDQIHFGCLYREVRPAFMSALFSATLHFFASNVETMKFGVIYALYFLFQSQPAGWPTECIRVTREQWTSLFDFYIACGQRGLREHALVAYVFKQLKDELGAFAFVMNEQVADASIFEIREKEPANTLIDEFHDFHASLLADDATTTCDNDVLRELQALNREYERVKTQACATPAATRVTQQWLKQTLSVDETNLRQLQRVMLKSIFPPHQEAAFDAFPAAARRLWQDRADSGIRDVDVLYRVNDDLPASANPAQATTASSAPATATASAAQTPPPPPATPNTVQDPLTPALPPETPPF